MAHQLFRLVDFGKLLMEVVCLALGQFNDGVYAGRNQQVADGGDTGGR